MYFMTVGAIGITKSMKSLYVSQNLGRVNTNPKYSFYEHSIQCQLEPGWPHAQIFSLQERAIFGQSPLSGKKQEENFFTPERNIKRQAHITLLMVMMYIIFHGIRAILKSSPSKQQLFFQSSKLILLLQPFFCTSADICLPCYAHPAESKFNSFLPHKEYLYYS